MKGLILFIMLGICCYHSKAQKENNIIKDIHYDTLHSVFDYELMIDERDGEIYRTIKIGSKVWMAENLRYNSGENITSNRDWANLDDNDYEAAYCFYDNDEGYKRKYGAYYTYAAAREACPSGWHLPTDEEWKELERFIGLSPCGADSIGWRGKNISTILKATVSWDSAGYGTNDYGFSAIAVGLRHDKEGIFKKKGMSAYWWSSTAGSNGNAYRRRIDFNNDKISRFDYGMSHGYSVRCIKD